MSESRAPIKQVNKDNLSARIYAQMRSALMNGQFEPGERLTISALAEQFGTSITPVREAIFRLVSERALEMRAATAVHVPHLDAGRLREVQLIRVELEGAAAERAAQLITEKQLAELTKIHQRFLSAAARDPAQASLLNRDFHFALLHVANMPILEGIVENAWVLMGPFLRMFHVHIPKRELSADEHLHHQVLEALRKRDAKGARAAIQDDIRWGNVLIDALERQNEAERKAATGRNGP